MGQPLTAFPQRKATSAKTRAIPARKGGHHSVLERFRRQACRLLPIGPPRMLAARQRLGPWRTDDSRR
jgi:hypothetical protein